MKLLKQEQAQSLSVPKQPSNSKVTAMNSLEILCNVCEHELNEMPTNQHTNPTSKSQHDFGPFKYSIEQTKLCKFSKFTGWHIQSKIGEMRIRIHSEESQSEDNLIVRTRLKRKNPAFKQYDITVCKKHIKHVHGNGDDNVLQPGHGRQNDCYTEQIEDNKSLCFKLGSKNEKSYETIALKFICNASCTTNNCETFVPSEATRDMVLILTLESLNTKQTLARREIRVWPKANVNLRDLVKTERRKAKGGAAQAYKKSGFKPVWMLDHTLTNAIVNNSLTSAITKAKVEGWTQNEFLLKTHIIWEKVEIAPVTENKKPCTLIPTNN